MRGRTHITGGVVAAAIAFNASGQGSLFVGLAVGASVIGGLMPDVDIETSKFRSMIRTKKQKQKRAIQFK